jgi:hypothetical protein
VDGNQIMLTFAVALDASATDVGNYAVYQWNYRRTAEYGSNDYRVRNPRQTGRDRLKVRTAELAGDERTLTIELADLKPSMQLELRYRLRAKDGTLLDQRLQQTLRRTGVLP